MKKKKKKKKRERKKEYQMLILLYYCHSFHLECSWKKYTLEIISEKFRQPPSWLPPRRGSGLVYDIVCHHWWAINVWEGGTWLSVCTIMDELLFFTSFKLTAMQRRARCASWANQISTLGFSWHAVAFFISQIKERWVPAMTCVFVLSTLSSN